jgi:hypothetical protein
MPTFRCTACEQRVQSPTVIGAGDCPRCGGDVVYDIHGGGPGGGAQLAAEEAADGLARVPLLRRILRR